MYLRTGTIDKRVSGGLICRAKKAFCFCLVFASISVAQSIETRPYAAFTLPVGAEVGFLSTAEVPVPVLSILAKGSLIYTPLITREPKQSLLTVSLQPGLRAETPTGLFVFSGGISFSPMALFPPLIIDYGVGPFAGFGIAPGPVELSIFVTFLSDKERELWNIGFISFAVSKPF